MPELSGLYTIGDAGQPVLLQDPRAVGDSYSSFTDYTVSRLDPYWVFSVPNSIVKDHGDIFTYEFGKIISTLLSRGANLGAACRGREDGYDICKYIRNNTFAMFFQWSTDNEQQLDTNVFSPCYRTTIIDGQCIALPDKERQYLSRFYIDRNIW